MSETRKNPLLRVLDGPFVLAAACTVAFYTWMHTDMMRGGLLYRYTTEHVVEYVIVALSFWGVIDILGKLAAFPRELMALKQPILPERHGREPAANAATLLAKIRELPPWVRNSRIARRYVEALQYVVDNGGAPEYRAYLRTISAEDAERASAQYTLVRFVVRIAPVLGFLGTVVHFGTALNGVDFNKMDGQLSVIVSEMGQAFNTTTVALGASMFMMFAQFICEWIDRGIVHSTDRQVERDLLTRFESRDPDMLPFLTAIRTANEDALSAMTATLQSQSVALAQALDGVIARFDRRQQLDVGAWTQALDTLAARHEAFDAVREERLRQALDLVDDRQERLVERMHGALEKVASLRDDVGGLADTLHAIARGEGRLVELQTALADNLRVIHESRQIDDALHGLTGAIHLLTARHRPDGERRAA